MKLISIDSTKIFHYISYLQYPMMVASVYYYYIFIKDIKNGINIDVINQILTLFGIALSFSTLQDTTKTQNKMSLRIWQNPRLGSKFLLTMVVFAFILFGVGLAGMLKSTNDTHKQLSIGLIVFGIGWMGLIKSAKEMFENHRLDKNPLPRTTGE